MFLFSVIQWALFKILRLRYRVSFRGTEVLHELQEHQKKKRRSFFFCRNKKKKHSPLSDHGGNRENNAGGILFLPNHPSSIDPVLLSCYLSKWFQTRPLVTEDVQQLPIVGKTLQSYNAVFVPNFEEGVNSYKTKQWKRSLQQVTIQARRGKNFLIYPSGRLKKTGRERLGGSSLIHQILQEVPKVRVVLVRVTGFWGSRFSRALSDSTPNVGKNLLSWAWTILKNGIFFAPRREVSFTFCLEDACRLRQMDRSELNDWLTRWYNAPFPETGEPLQLVRDVFWSSRKPTPKVREEKKKEIHDVPIKVQNQIVEQIQQLVHTSQKKISPSDRLGDDLGLDSLDVADLITFMQKQFSARIMIDEFTTVADMMFAAVQETNSKPKLKTPSISKEALKAWEKSKRKAPLPPQGNTLEESFLLACDRMKGAMACADEATGSILSYKKMRLTALLLADQLRKVPQHHIGILLPASNAAYITILSILLAGKIPVLLNWTQGSAHLAEAVSISGIKTIITSKTFLNRVHDVDFGDIDELFLPLESLRKKISPWAKLKGLFKSLKSTRSIVSHLGTTPEETALILFTSGTEGKPKGVPLSHANILSNLKSVYNRVQLQKDDVIYGFLPPFHVFGCNITGLMPIFCGMRVVFSPSPLDSQTLLAGIKKWSVSLFCSAPSFLLPVIQLAQPYNLETLRLIITGSERMPEQLLELMKPFGIPWLEGYGITECSPVLTTTLLHSSPDVQRGDLSSPPTQPEGSVGQPIKGVKLCICDPDTLDPLPRNQVGLVLASGPNVFSGYLSDAPSPFVETDGRTWYNTGDLGYLDKDRFLFLTGRKKRVIKIGAEMIGLAMLEQKLTHIAIQKRWERPDEAVPCFACVGKEGEGKSSITLFSSIQVSKEEINSALKEAGFPNVVKVARVINVDYIPLGGSGKIDYKYLEHQLES